MSKKIAVLIPCYNESVTIEKVVNDFHAALPEADIYVYDNNSTDNTFEIAKNSGAIVRREYRQGKGNVIRTMFREIDADCYIMTDGDDTYPAEYAREMAELVLSGRADMVIGDRLSATYFEENKRPFHGFGNSLVRGCINTFWARGKNSKKILDVMTGYRAFSYMFVKSFPILSQGFEIETEMTIHALDKNLLIESLPVNYRDRPAGSFSKLNTYVDGVKVLMTIFNLYRNYRPLRFFGAAAILMMIIALIMFLPVFVEFLETGIVPRFPTLIVSGMLALSSILSAMCGLILDTIALNAKKDFELKMNLIKIFHLKRAAGSPLL